MERAKITVFDTTLRDGEQSPGCSMNVREKLRMAQQLERLGVDVIEAGFPIASDGDFESVQAIAALFRRPIVAALARCCTPDIERATAAVKDAARPRIHTFLATSDIHLTHKLKMTREHCLKQAAESVRLAKSLCPEVQFSPEDATRTEHSFLMEVLSAVVEAGATILNIPDTVGCAMPEEYGNLIRDIRQKVRGMENVVISTHCHDDLGLAVANTLAALQAGARQVECTVNGIGERAGNAALEEIVMAMRVRPDHFAFDTAIVSEHLYPSSQLLSEITKVNVQPNKAVTGRNAFAHEAGIHQDGMLKNPLTYEIMTPRSVGVPDSQIVLGKHSGRHALAVRCGHLGYEFERRELDEIYRRFVVLADRIKTVQDHDLLGLIREVREHGTRIPPAHVEAIPPALAAAAVAGAARPFPAAIPPDHGIPISPMAEHHAEQEDYLWGV